MDVDLLVVVFLGGFFILDIYFPRCQVSTYQMCILLKFNQRPQWSYQEIADETEIPDRDLMRAMQSLTMGKIGQRVLARIGDGAKVCRRCLEVV